jgi:hypothetical protein
MKKILVLSILGLTVAAVSSYGQGTIAFNTYVADGGSGIITTYGNGSSSGGIDSTFTGELLFSTTPITEAATTALTANAPLNPLWTVASTAMFNTPSTVAVGYLTGPNFVYEPSGAGSGGGTFYFEIAAFDGASYGAGSYDGHSASFQATMATGTTFASADQIDAMAPFQVFTTVPEPTTLALGGLGALSLLAFRRRKV